MRVVRMLVKIGDPCLGRLHLGSFARCPPLRNTRVYERCMEQKQVLQFCTQISVLMPNGEETI